MLERVPGMGARTLPKSSSTALNMVLTTPEAIIEKASTQNLLDELIDESVRTASRRPIIMQFDPSSGWIWRRWKGTVFSETWTSCVRNMAYALIVLYFYRKIPGVDNYLSGFSTLWGQLLSVTTFTLTFFVNQSYALWRKCTELSRRLQGRLLDIGMNCATHAARKTPTNPSEPSTYTPASRQILELMARYVRLFNLLTYASFTRSHRPILTPRGMRRLVERGLMTAQERETLVQLAIPGTQRHSAILMWMIRLFIEGRAAGHIGGGDGFEQQTMEKFHVIRAQYGAIGDELNGRMPLAYAHIVQVLVDLILWMYPIMALSTGMSPYLVVLGTGLLTVSYQGLFDLAKQFLDPYDNESYGRGEDPLSVDTLIAESNAGSVRWLNGFEYMPYSAQRVKDGELYDYLLPQRGYSVEELAQMEEDRKQKELEIEQQKQREEERRQQELLEQSEEEEAEEDDTGEELEVDTVATDESITSEANATTATNILEDRNDAFISDNSMSDDRAQLEEAGKLESTQDVAQLETDRWATVHKVTTVAGGIAVTLDPAERIDTNNDEDDNGNDIESESEDESESKHEDEVQTEDAEEQAAVEVKNLTAQVDVEMRNLTSKVSTIEEMVEGDDEDFFMWLEKPLEVPSDEEIQQSQQPSSPARPVTPPEPRKVLRPRKPAPVIVEDVDEEEDEDNYEPDYSSFSDVPWFDQVGPDGKEIRMSQCLADEVWEEEKQAESVALSYEEFTQQMADLEEEARNELMETVEILNASPGSEDAKEVIIKKKPAPPKYDQTRLDGISQLWGLVPESEDDYVELEPAEPIEDESFADTFLLWGKVVERPPPTEEDDEIVGTTFSGVSELWNYERMNSNKEMGEFVDDDDQESPDFRAAFSTLPWHDETGSDGNEFRLSQMLADEAWDEEVEAATPPPSPISYEEYKEQATEILTKAEEEYLETEAILNAAPGSDPKGWDGDEDKSLFSIQNHTEIVEQEEEDLGVLEMDVDDFESGDNSTTTIIEETNDVDLASDANAETTEVDQNDFDSNSADSAQSNLSNDADSSATDESGSNKGTDGSNNGTDGSSPKKPDDGI